MRKEEEEVIVDVLVDESDNLVLTKMVNMSP